MSTQLCRDCGRPVPPEAPQMDSSHPLCRDCQDADFGCYPCGCEPGRHYCGTGS